MRSVPGFPSLKKSPRPALPNLLQLPQPMPSPQVWLQLAVLLGITFSIVKGVERWRAPALGYLAIASVLTMDTANTYIYFNSTPVNNHSAARATAAGAVICSIGK